LRVPPVLIRAAASSPGRARPVTRTLVACRTCLNRGRQLLPGLVLFALVACSLALSPAAGSPQELQKGLTLEALLKMEGLGEARFDPTGRWLVFERIRPYDAFPDYSYRTHAFHSSGHQVWRVDLQAGSEPELMPGIDPATHAWIESFSPDGTRLAIMQYSAGRFSLSTCEMESGACTVFEPVPRTDWTGDYHPIWVSEDQLVYTALPEGQEAAQASLRTATGAWLTKTWAAAWRGDTVTSDEVRTRPSVTSFDPASGQLVKADARTGAADLLAEGRYADLRLSPDGEQLAALAVSGPLPLDPDRLQAAIPRRHRLVLFDMQTGRQEQLADGMDFAAYTLGWAHEGDRLLGFAWEDGSGPSSGRFRVIDTATGDLKTYTHKGLDLASERERGFAMRPERAVFLGKDIAVFARPAPAGHKSEALFTPKDIGEPELARADWYRLLADGTHKALTGDLDHVSGVPLEMGADCVLIQAGQGLYCLGPDGQRKQLIDVTSSDLHLVPAGSYSTYGALSRPDPGGDALVEASRGEASGAILISPAAKGLPDTMTLKSPRQGASAVAGSLKAKATLFRKESEAESELLLVQAGEDEGARSLARVNSHLKDVAFGTWQSVSYRLEHPEDASVSEEVASCLLLPPNTTEVPLPLIVEVYPGIMPRCEVRTPILSFPNPRSPYLWAGRGYAYARIALPREYIRTDDGPIAGMDEAVETTLDALIATGHVDPDRMVLSGFSQGAVSALYVAAHSDRFKAVIAGNGWADLTSHYFGPPGIYSILDTDYFGSEFIRYEAEAGSEFGIGRTPFEDPEVFYRNSPVLLAPDINAPVLLMHSDMDSFAMEQFDEMYSALLRAGKDARYVRYWGEGHGPSSPANIRDMWTRFDAFMEQVGVMPAADGSALE
jgi:dipeptidyl aminopeptidase/acylaminoacyl peptidase